ncbi:MAG: hypothetical protein KBF84_07360 [Candidatus Microthrix sp.]|jgi:hypothetical protein|uniref:DUF192 domain-containing protein n=1 Tax=Candidatus Neomicrothrix subdominans TaxID=2954438 RepID=A0A936TBV4_9ACTN|nr:hypothetical protein [Candidatus Microthrix sp.]MBK9295796.1 hypothetical protein [Candidatus Microthrix subdominans]MBK6310754.1 hypothetical protein [Candidatus Microthrix sp.]MBK6438601.1 hypothetical protein [Candidatus Microthrix sp.]MBP7595328.1 hypothetical protein [Candidatus Microthrix sp.]MBP9065889.1 hypothetical protein [Candidatus Microthrix sp.]
MSWSFASTCERVAGVAITATGAHLLLRRAGGPWGRARGLLALPGLLNDVEVPTALWLGRTPQVHTFGMDGPIAVVTAGVTRRGARRGRPCGLRVRGVDVLNPGKVGRWSWAAPCTLELHPLAADRLGLAPGSPLDIEWGCPSGSAAA